MNHSTRALRNALAEVWSGADLEDAAAVMDHLHDQGYDVTPVPDTADLPRRREAPRGRTPANQRLSG